MAGNKSLHAVTYKEQRNKKSRELKLANTTITDMQVHQREMAELDAKHTKKSADARAENNNLRRKLSASGRVRVKGVVRPCPVM